MPDLLYQADLAYIQAAGFGDLAARATPEIIRLLRDNGISQGTVGDVGCGAGVSTGLLLADGFDVWALDASPFLLDIARQAAPRARLLPATSLYDAELPPARAIIALGEPLGYHPPSRDADGLVEGFFVKAAKALDPGGLLIFDIVVAGPDALDGKGWVAAEDWAILFETVEDRSSGWLRRDIETFRKIEGGYRRSCETHHVRLFDRDRLAHALLRTGFTVETAPAYGAYSLAPRRLAFFCRRS